jgi:uncharacterized protein YndB with AHSA1/START domain
MNGKKKTIEVKVQRVIPAPVVEVFDAWLNPKILGNAWKLVHDIWRFFAG